MASISNEIPKKRGRKPKVETDTPIKNKKTHMRIQTAIRNLPNKGFFDGTSNENEELTNEKAPVISLILHLPIKSSDVEDNVPIFNSEKFFGKLAEKNGTLLSEIEGKILENPPDIFIEPKPKKKNEQISENNPFLSAYGIKDDGKYTLIEKSNWVKSTNSYCWWCCHPFDNVPCGIPDDYDELTGTFYLYGCFCSFNCCLAYIIEHLEEKQWEKTALLHLLYKKTYNRDDAIIPAKRKELLSVFGGYLDIKEFRNSSISLDLMDITLPPVSSVRPKLEQRNFFQSVARSQISSFSGKTGGDGLFNLSSLMEERGKTYRIQRNRPIKEQNDKFIKCFLKSDNSNTPVENNQQGHQQ